MCWGTNTYSHFKSVQIIKVSRIGLPASDEVLADGGHHMIVDELISLEPPGATKQELRGEEAAETAEPAAGEWVVHRNIILVTDRREQKLVEDVRIDRAGEFLRFEAGLIDERLQHLRCQLEQTEIPVRFVGFHELSR